VGGYNILPSPSLANLRNGLSKAGFGRAWRFKSIINGVTQLSEACECIVVGQSDEQEWEDETERSRKVRVRRVTLRPIPIDKLGAAPVTKLEVKMGDVAIAPDNLEYIVERIAPSDVPRIECVLRTTIGQAPAGGFLAVGKVNP